MSATPDKETPVVLIADDDDMIRNITSGNLRKDGFDVMPARDGGETLALYRDTKPDIILLDVQMPVLDGFGVCEQIRATPGGENVPILMITGQDDVESIRRAYKAGATDFISKPVKWMILTQRIRYMLRAGDILKRFQKSEAHLADAQTIAGLGSWEFSIFKNEFWCSKQTLRILGLSETNGTVDQDTFTSLIHPDDKAAWAGRFAEAIQQEVPFELDHRILLKGGAVRFVYQKVTIPLNEDRQGEQIIGTLQDITQRKLLEMFEADRNHALEMIIRGESLTSILDHLVQMATTQMPEGLFQMANVQDGQLMSAAGSELPGEIQAILDHQLIGPHGDASAVAAYLDEPVIAVDIARHPLWQSHAAVFQRHGIRSCHTLPITSGKGQILGILNMFQGVCRACDAAQIDMLGKICRLASVAIERHHLLEKIDYQARYDLLTGLPNRASILDYIRNNLMLSKRYAYKNGIFCIGLDRFKQINDSFGHFIGDSLICKVAQRLQEHTRTSEQVGRMGGDQFNKLIIGFTQVNEVATAAKRVLDLFTEPFQVEGHELHMGASIGIVISPDDGDNVVTLQKNAEIAMYYAKNNGGNRFEFFSRKMNEVASERYKIENDLRKALENHEFEVHYQPKFHLKTRKLAGFEALIRWRHPELGLVSPGKFIPVAEDSKLIIPMGTWILREVCRQNAKWQKRGFGPYKIAVNVSIEQFMQPDFVQIVEKTLQDTGLAPEYLELEITEGILIRDVETITSILSHLQGLGVKIAMDDFGTGYSSLSYLNKLSLDTLKIDQSFVFQIETSKQSQALINTIINLAQSLDLQLVAEGVENETQLEWLNREGCQLGQGFFYSTPKSAEVIENEYVLPELKLKNAEHN